MNERIKELAALSGFKVDWQHEDVQALKMARFEKFAELIVRECRQVLVDMIVEGRGDFLTLDIALIEIDDTFGIEEE